MFKVRVTTIWSKAQHTESYDFNDKDAAFRKMAEEAESLKRCAYSELTDIIGYHVQLEEITDDGKIRRITEDYECAE